MRTAITCLLLAAGACGCVSMPRWWEKPKPAPPTPVVVRPRPAVSAEQITDGNAQEMAAALLDELDRAAQAESLPPVETAAGDSQPGDGKRR